MILQRHRNEHVRMAVHRLERREFVGAGCDGAAAFAGRRVRRFLASDRHVRCAHNHHNDVEVCDVADLKRRPRGRRSTDRLQRSPRSEDFEEREGKRAERRAIVADQDVRVHLIAVENFAVIRDRLVDFPQIFPAAEALQVDRIGDGRFIDDVRVFVLVQLQLAFQLRNQFLAFVAEVVVEASFKDLKALDGIEFFLGAEREFFFIEAEETVGSWLRSF